MKEIKKSTADFRLPRSVLRWVAVGLAVSTAVVVIIALFSGVTLLDLARLGYLPFGLAAAVSAARLFVQIMRFRVITVGLAGDSKLDMRGLATVRMASEFLSLSTPAMIGGPVLRATWLSGKGVNDGKALWVGYFEVILDVYVGSALALISAWFAFTRGATILGSTIALIAAILITGYTVIFIVPAIKTIKVPHSMFTLAVFLVGGPRATNFYLRAVVGSLNFSLAARAIMNRNTRPMLVKAVGLTIIEDSLAGTALWLVLNAAGLKIDFLSATFVTFGALTIAAIPISIGGSGLTELTVQSYISLVYGFSSWAAVILWRIATYQVPLVITGVIFLLFVRKATKPTSKVQQKT